MDALIHQFFNLDIMSRALPLILTGLQMTLLLCLVVIPLGLAGGAKQPSFQRIETMRRRKKSKSRSIPHHNSRRLRTDFDDVTV